MLSKQKTIPEARNNGRILLAMQTGGWVLLG
jgi:hypothetical protein